MKQYCVAYINFHENELEQKFVWADSDRDAAITAFDLEYCFPEDNTSMEEAKNIAFSGDEMFSVVRIT